MEIPANGSLRDESLNRLRFRARQAAGKVRRFFRANIYTAENEKLLSKRQGECNRCGACCKILFKCPFLVENLGADPGNLYTCGIYGEHFSQCRIYPLVPQDLLEVEEPCSYTFTQ
jgi:hypothetical protein